MKKYIVTMVFLSIATVCYTASTIIGSEVLPDGTLKEPFYLIGIGGFSVIGAIISGIVSTLILVIEKIRNR